MKKLKVEDFFSHEIWTTEEVAEYLRISPDMVRLEARRKRLPGAFQIGTLWRFNAASIRDLGKRKEASGGDALD